MRFVRAALIACCASLASCASGAPRGDDAQAIYRVFLASYANDGGKLNLGNRTTPLHLSGMEMGCIEGFTLESSVVPLTHALPADLSPHVVLVDAQEQQRRISDPMLSMQRGQSVEDAVDTAFDNGLLTLSEVAFDHTHTHAVFEYAFECGALCGNGATVIYERTDEGWKRSSRECISWVS